MHRSARRLGALAALATAFALPAAHAADSGFYLGGGLGTARQEGSFLNGNFDKEDTAKRVFAGYRFGWLPILDIAAEAGYRDFGKPNTDFSGSRAEVRMTGFDAAALVILPILPIDLYGKAGVLRYDLDRSAGATTLNATGNAAFYGVGAGFRVWRVNIRAEYERFNVPELQRSDMFSVNAYFRF
jgi:hypothetical protein